MDAIRSAGADTDSRKVGKSTSGNSWESGGRSRTSPSGVSKNQAFRSVRSILDMGLWHLSVALAGDVGLEQLERILRHVAILSR